MRTIECAGAVRRHRCSVPRNISHQMQDAQLDVMAEVVPRSPDFVFKDEPPS